jgi:hypothetical protein
MLQMALADEEATVVRILSMDVDGERRSVVAPVCRGGGGGQSEQCGERARGGDKKVDGFHPGCPRAKDKACAERTGTTGDQQWQR